LSTTTARCVSDERAAMPLSAFFKSSNAATAAATRVRLLNIFVKDPSTSQRAIAVACVPVAIPDEMALGGKLRNAAIEIRCSNGVPLQVGMTDLDPATVEPQIEPLDSDILDWKPEQNGHFDGGYPPSTSDNAFAGQMVYAVAVRTIALFERALGRDMHFRFGRKDTATGLNRPDAGRLILRINAMKQANAFFDPELGRICFGYFNCRVSSKQVSAVDPQQYAPIFSTALSHDIVTHEMCHALLDTVRPHLLLPSHPDVLAFHEGFADLVAIFSQFQHEALVTQAIWDARGELDSEILLTLARELGRTVYGNDNGLRRAVPHGENATTEKAGSKLFYSATRSCHELGEVLLSAVFFAFRRVFNERSRSLKFLIGDNIESREAAQLLAAQVRTLARHFLNLIIRAIDFLPPVDVTFGDYLRALLTADTDLVPQDKWGYRDAIISGFRHHAIPVALDDGFDLSEDALQWSRVDSDSLWAKAFCNDVLGRLKTLGSAEGQRESVCSAIDDWARQYAVDLHLHSDNALWIDSIDHVERVAPEGGIRREWVICLVQYPSDWRDVIGGVTLIADSQMLRYAIHKRVGSAQRNNILNWYLTTSGNSIANDYNKSMQEITAPDGGATDGSAIAASLRRFKCRLGMKLHGDSTLRH
jgi:hypothetical protein